jgi:hypothetical protein
MKKMVLMMALTVVLQGCTGFALLGINSRDLKGQNIDEVVRKVGNRGLSCGEEYQPKDLGGNSYGLVICGATGMAPICPTSYSARIVFDLQTRKVLSVMKDERDNCF